MLLTQEYTVLFQSTTDYTLYHTMLNAIEEVMAVVSIIIALGSNVLSDFGDQFLNNIQSKTKGSMKTQVSKRIDVHDIQENFTATVQCYFENMY